VCWCMNDWCCYVTTSVLISVLISILTCANTVLQWCLIGYNIHSYELMYVGCISRACTWGVGRLRHIMLKELYRELSLYVHSNLETPANQTKFICELMRLLLIQTCWWWVVSLLLVPSLCCGVRHLNDISFVYLRLFFGTLLYFTEALHC